MYKRSQSVLLLISFVTLVFVLRSSNVSPGSFLKQQLTRVLQQAKPSDTLCQGIDLSQGFTASERERAEGLRNTISNARSGNPLINFIEGPEPSSKFGSDYVVPLYPFAAPWAAFFAIGLLTALVFLVNWFCTYCSCCRCCSCCTHPKQSRLRTFYIITSIIFMTAVIAAGIAGIIVSRDIPKDGKRTVCNLALFVETVADGSTEDDWIGIRPAAEKLLTVLNSFNSTVNSLQETNNSFTEINNRLTAATDAIDAMYNNNRNLFVATQPNPEDSGSYQPTYIQSLGPQSNSSTATGSIELEMQLKKYVVTNASEFIDSAVRELKNNRSAIGSSLITGRNVADTVLSSVSDVLQTVQDFGTKANNIINAISGGLLGVFIAKMVVAAFALTSILLVCCGVKFFNKCVHLSWCALGLLMLLGFILSTVALPLSVMLSEGCEVTDKIIVNPTFFNETFEKFIGSSNKNSQEAKDTIYRCLYGDGSVLGQFHIQNTLDQFDQIFTYLDDTANLTEYVQQVPDSVIIPLNQALISKFQSGLLPDAQISVEDLFKLNALTNKNSNKCTQVTDTWVLNSASCQSSFGTVFTATNAETFNLNSPTCIGLDVWGSKDITQRYNTNTFPTSSCGNVGGVPANTYLQNFVNQFVTSRQEVNTIFTRVSANLDTVSARNAEFMTSVKNITNTFVPIISTTRTMYNALANPTDGLLANSNCTFIKESLNDIRDSMCVGFTTSVFETSIAMIVISFMSYFGMFSLFCLAKKFLATDKVPATQRYNAA